MSSSSVNAGNDAIFKNSRSSSIRSTENSLTTSLLRIAVYDGRLRERAYLLHGGMAP